MAVASPAATPAPPQIRLRDVAKSFGPKVVLDGLDLDVFEGESLVIIGGSGTGKSVLLKHIVGLIRPDRGSVEVDGVRVPDLDPGEITRFRRRFGMAFQEGALFDSMTVAENVAFPLTRSRGWGRAEIRERVAECLAAVRLEGVGDKTPSQLSGGMRRRVGLARAIAHRPRILLFDEPTTGLDPVTKGTIIELIVKIRREIGSTTITISHDMASVFRIADRVGMLLDGRLIAIAPGEEFRQLPDPRVQQFLRGEAKGPLTGQSASAAADTR